MPDVPLNSIDDYESYLSTTLTGWSPRQRLAFTAGMAERWLPAYAAFAAEEQWGDADALRRSLDAVWDHLAGHPLRPPDRARHQRLLRDSTPHMDDFDAIEALIACSVLSEALDACGTDDNARHAMGAALAGFEAALPDEALDPAEQPRLWQKLAARRELKGQLALIEAVGALTRFDAAALKDLRRKLERLQVKLETARPKEASGPPPLTNQASFDYYRRALEGRLGRPAPQALASGDAADAALQYFGEWALRYMQRMDAFQGHYGKLADEAAWQALTARHRASDAADHGEPQWERLAREIIDTALNGNYMIGRLDAGAADKPHGYGPSIRRLWMEAKRRGASDREAAQSIIDWAHRRPAAWEAEDKRMRQGQAHSSPALGAALAQRVSWTATGDLDYPWASEVEGARWQVRLNDFPDEVMYTLLSDGTPVGDFHDWPETWARE